MTLREEILRNSGINTINEEVVEEGVISKIIAKKIGKAIANKLAANEDWMSMSEQQKLDAIKEMSDGLFKFAKKCGADTGKNEAEVQSALDRAQKRINGKAAKDFEDSEAPADEKEAEDAKSYNSEEYKTTRWLITQFVRMMRDYAKSHGGIFDETKKETQIWEKQNIYPMIHKDEDQRAFNHARKILYDDDMLK